MADFDRSKPGRPGLADRLTRSERRAGLHQEGAARQRVGAEAARRNVLAIA